MPKTYSRARAAVTALKKIVEAHEAENFEITPFEAEPGRFGAEVNFLGQPDPLLVADIEAAGFTYEWDEPEAPASEDAIAANDPALEVAEPEHLFNLFSAGALAADQYTVAATLWAEAAVENGDISVPEKVAYLQLVEGQVIESAAAGPAKSPSGYIREKSKGTGAVARVWAIADEMKGAARKDVIEACRQQGIAYGTARTQYQAWKKAQG
jgi:hypothetical protein